MTAQYKAIDGIRMKIRTDADSVVATLWVDEKPLAELLRAPIAVLGRPGSDAHQSFQRCASEIMCTMLKDVTGIPVRGKFRRPDYKGEPIQ